MSEQYGAIQTSYGGISPIIKGRLSFSGSGAAVLGRVKLGSYAWLGAFSVIRADGHDAQIGSQFWLGEHATVHIAHDYCPTHIGNHVTTGENTVIHACTIGDDCVIERNAIILDGTEIGAGAIVSAGSVVFPRSKLDGGWIYAGSPAKPIARVSTSELNAYHQKLRNHPSKNVLILNHQNRPVLDCFVAPTAYVTGDIQVGDGVGIWYGCCLDAGNARITIGDGTNIQDNCSILSDQGDTVIEPNVTIGHNVTMVDCRIESHSLVGIGSKISSGTIVEGDVLVAAGTETEEGQRLNGGQIWAGRPARPIGKLDTRKRAMLKSTLLVYQIYADHFSRATHVKIEQLGEK